MCKQEYLWMLYKGLIVEIRQLIQLIMHIIVLLGKYNIISKYSTVRYMFSMANFYTKYDKYKVGMFYLAALFYTKYDKYIVGMFYIAALYAIHIYLMIYVSIGEEPPVGAVLVLCIIILRII